MLRGRRKRCVDSTVFDDAVATQDTVIQLVAAIRKVARVVPGAGEVIGAVCTLDYSRPGKPPIDWDDPAAKDALVSDLVNDSLAVLDALAGPGAPQRGGAAADALGLLALVAGQDVEPAEDSDGTDGRWRIARKVAGDRVISTVDPQARHTRKSKSVRRDGFRGHLAAEPETGLITGCEMTMAAGEGSSDAENGVKLVAGDQFTAAVPAGSPAGEGTAPGDARQAAGLEVYGDSHYGSGDARAAYRDAGHDTVIKPAPLRPAIPGGFTLDDFTVGQDAGTVTCPAGVTRPMSSKTRTVTFGAACTGCPLRERCTTAKDGRSMSIHPHEGLLRAARAQARTPAFKKAYPTRSVIELQPGTPTPPSGGSRRRSNEPRNPFPQPIAGECLIGRLHKATVAVADQEVEVASAFGEVHEQAAACWAVHAPVGSAVTPRMCTRRVLISITKNTYRRLRNTMRHPGSRTTRSRMPGRGQELPPGR